jgi:hypothetical protein
VVHRLQRTAGLALLFASLLLLANTTFAQAVPARVSHTALAQSQRMPALGDPRRAAPPIEHTEPACTATHASKRGRRIGIAVGVTLGTLLLLGAGFAIGMAAIGRSSIGSPTGLRF